MKMMTVRVLVAACLILALTDLPEAATLNPSDLLMVDGHTSVLQIDPETGAVDVITRAGRFQAGMGVALEASGHILVSALFVALPGGGDAPGVVRVDPATGAQSIVTTGGYFSAPVALAVAEDGVIYVADRSSQVIAVDPVTGAQTLLASGVELANPSGLVEVPTPDKKKKK